MSQKIWATIEMTLIAITDKAYGFAESDESKEVDMWLPKSQVEVFNLDRGDISADFAGVGDFVLAAEMPAWLAREKDLDF